MPKFDDLVPDQQIPDFSNLVEDNEDSGDFSETDSNTDRANQIGIRPTYSWAMDCDWVWQNLGGKMTEKKAGSRARWELWKLAKEDMPGFVNNMMPKAMLLLEKALDKQGDTDVVIVKERKQIAELRQILVDALAEAQSIKP